MSWETKKACGPNWKRTGGHRGTTDTHGTWMPPGGPPLNFELGLLLCSCCGLLLIALVGGTGAEPLEASRRGDRFL